MKQPQLTVVVPVHNTAPYLDKCIGSLLNQTFTDYELILVNNCSTDNSLAICHNWAGRDSRVNVLDIEEASLAAARNAGIAAAEGRYITFVDSDDWLEPQYLAEFFRTPLPEGNIVVKQGILHDWSEYPGMEYKTRNEFCYDDIVYHIADGKQADVRNAFLLNAFSFCILFDVEILRRHNIRVQHIPYHEDHLFFFDYLRHVDTVICRSGKNWAHYMIRNRITLSNISVPSQRALLSARLLRDSLPDMIERFNVCDDKYLRELYSLIISPVNKALQNIRYRDHAVVIKEVAQYLPFINKITTKNQLLMLTRTQKILLRQPRTLGFATYLYCCWRRFSLRKRGRL